MAWAREVAALGAGEILLTSMDRDGARSGFDLALTRAVVDAVGVPVIASGGVGSLSDLVDGIVQGGADAVLAASIFHYCEFTISEAKGALAAAGIEVHVKAGRPCHAVVMGRPWSVLTRPVKTAATLCDSYTLAETRHFSHDWREQVKGDDGLVAASRRTGVRQGADLAWMNREALTNGPRRPRALMSALRSQLWRKGEHLAMCRRCRIKAHATARATSPGRQSAARLPPARALLFLSLENDAGWEVESWSEVRGRSTAMVAPLRA